MPIDDLTGKEKNYKKEKTDICEWGLESIWRLTYFTSRFLSHAINKLPIYVLHMLFICRIVGIGCAINDQMNKKIMTGHYSLKGYFTVSIALLWKTYKPQLDRKNRARCFFHTTGFLRNILVLRMMIDMAYTSNE